MRESVFRAIMAPLGSVHLSEWVHVHVIKLYVHSCLCTCEIIMSDCLTRTSEYEYSAVRYINNFNSVNTQYQIT